jgi:hypothetical protein
MRSRLKHTRIPRNCVALHVLRVCFNNDARVFVLLIGQWSFSQSLERIAFLFGPIMISVNTRTLCAEAHPHSMECHTVSGKFAVHVCFNCDRFEWRRFPFCLLYSLFCVSEVVFPHLKKKKKNPQSPWISCRDTLVLWKIYFKNCP